MVSNRRHAKLLRRAALCRRAAGVSQPKGEPDTSIFPLLALPAEIRAIILRELLWDPEPIFFGLDKCEAEPRREDPYWDMPCHSSQQRRSETLYPAILRVCRQLYQEGEPILYDNTIKCLIEPCAEDTVGDGDAETPVLIHERYNAAFEPPPRAWRDFQDYRERSRAYLPSVSYLRCASATYDLLPSGLRYKARKIYVEILLDVDLLYDRTVGEVPEEVLLPFFRTMWFLEKHTNYQQLDIRLKLLHDDELLPDTYEDPLEMTGTDVLLREFCSTLRSELPVPLTYLRNRASLKTQGFAPYLDRHFQAVMTDRPVLNLHAMHEVLVGGLLDIIGDFDQAEIPCKGFIELSLGQVTDARNDCNEEAFLHHRSELLSLFAIINVVQMRKMLSMDEKGLPTSYRGPFLCAGSGVDPGEWEPQDETSSLRRLLRDFQGIVKGEEDDGNLLITPMSPD